MAATVTQRLLTIAEVAERLEMTRDGVYKLIQRGKLQTVRLSERKTRVVAQSLDQYIDASQAWADRYFAAQRRADHETVLAAFVTDAGMSPEAWLAAWKRDEVEDTAENMALLVRAAALRGDEPRQAK